MRRTLLITNDFPPRPGGIQTYLHALALRLPPAGLVVYAPQWSGAGTDDFDAEQPFPVIRHTGTLILPTPRVTHRAKEIVGAYGCDAVWFGSAAPLALLAPALRKAGAERVLASTHGREVRWSALPGTRRALRRMGSTVDVVTYVSSYTHSKFASAFGPHADLEYLPPGVDTGIYRPDTVSGRETRRRYRLESRPVVACVSRLVRRKGVDMLLRALPSIRRRVPDTALLIVGDGPDRRRLQRIIRETGLGRDVVLTGAVAEEELPAHYVAGDVFAMPCRTRGHGWDLEGLGIVYLEASASGLPVVAGSSGGAPEAVHEGVTGQVVDGRSPDAIATAVAGLLADPARAAAMGAAGRDWAVSQWSWDTSAARLAALLEG
ncbi:alpha-(1-2)-phosphatidylinositol mannosyltransferase [Nocardiopsis gilva YIM 90087]|uniref:phosphatidyl-myo-inositol dimannoside synthase n=1 Tax=Nocardiopsis gilva YIM 90087 TaxID=1235441 RepID=A0A223SCX3_9ACTN|nr:glycosyltransferase family 4 protein [Nocardiopsis gilva]ASU86014.1 alpha-(1-2)-phosphatidylinositol mannosyltransferase [Nocardiopsis gilva YIM 90087]